MKAVILAGGLGTRISEESQVRPKPLIEIGGCPILWHLMKIYAAHGVNEFVICCGYKGYLIKEYFNNYYLHMSDVTFDMENNTREIHNSRSENWKVTLVDTGENSMTGARLARIYDYVKDEPYFHFTYGDGVSDVDITALTAFHQQHGKIATLTAVIPPGRYGSVEMEGTAVKRFVEKPPGDGGYINGGFFVLSNKVFDGYVSTDESCVWEQQPLMQLATDNQLQAWEHRGFWRPMDTLRDKRELELLWQKGNPPWKIW